MKQELRTMEEKQKLDPNELMENGLTRKENEDQAKSTENFSSVVNIILMFVSLWAMAQACSSLNALS